VCAWPRAAPRSQVQHGADPAPDVPEHHHLCPQPHRRGPHGALRQQHQLPHGGGRGHRRQRWAPRGVPPDVRLPADALHHGRCIRAAGAVLRGAPPAQLPVVNEGHRGVLGSCLGLD
jgi:hypothetical protein